MFHEQHYDLSRQKYHEYNAKYEGLYVPLQDEKPGLVQPLLAALRGSSAMRARAGGARQGKASSCWAVAK